MLNTKLRDMSNASNDAGATYIVVGALPLAAIGLPCSTSDFIIWARPARENATRVWAALKECGALRQRLTGNNFTTPNSVNQIGIAPNRIDIPTSIDGVEFDNAWQNRNQIQINALEVLVIGREELLKNRRATGRPRDLADVAWLEQAID